MRERVASLVALVALLTIGAMAVYWVPAAEGPAVVAAAPAAPGVDDLAYWLAVAPPEGAAP